MQKNTVPGRPDAAGDTGFIWVVVLTVVVLLLVAVVGFWYWSPLLALHSLQAEVVGGEVEAVMNRIDVAQVRESLRVQLTQRGAAQKLPVGPEVVDPTVDAMMQPEALMRLISAPRKGGDDASDQAARVAGIASAEMTVGSLKRALVLYRIQHGDFPTEQEGLAAMTIATRSAGPTRPPYGPLLNEIPLDPWGRPYRYLRPGNGATVGVIYDVPSDVNGYARDVAGSSLLETERVDVDSIRAQISLSGDAHDLSRAPVLTIERRGFAQWVIVDVALAA